MSENRQKDMYHLDMDIMDMRFGREWSDRQHLESIVKKHLPDMYIKYEESSAKRRKHVDDIIDDKIKEYRLKYPRVE